MIAQQSPEVGSDDTESDVVQPMNVSLAGAGPGPELTLAPAEAATGPAGYRLSGLVPGRPYQLSSPEERDETTRQVRAHFGHEDFWEPV